MKEFIFLLAGLSLITIGLLQIQNGWIGYFLCSTGGVLLGATIESLINK